VDEQRQQLLAVGLVVPSGASENWNRQDRTKPGYAPFGPS
jgi:hypothetical protein